MSNAPVRSPLDGLAGALTRSRPSTPYQLGLAVVALVMLLLPAIYVGLIVLVGWGAWHAASDSFIPQGASGSWFSLLFYLGPKLVGLVVILFMVKPLLAGRAPAPPAMALDAEEERLLFAFIARICRLVGAPRPRRVEVNCAVNAAAGFRLGAASLFGQDMTLVIGLPLAAGLSLGRRTGTQLRTD